MAFVHNQATFASFQKSRTQYLLRGGFLHADDFWGVYQRAHFAQQMAKVFLFMRVPQCLLNNSSSLRSRTKWRAISTPSSRMIGILGRDGDIVTPLW